MENDFLLTFELSGNKVELYVHTNLNGLRNLIEELEKLLKSAEKDENDHIHLMTEEWGGYELSSESQGDEVLNHVKIYCWKTNK